MMSLWNFSNAIYAVPSVADECLLLQDKYGVDVNLLLFCCYAAVVRGIQLSEEDMVDIEQHVADLRSGVVVPLRNCRKTMKQGLATLRHKERKRAEYLRSKVKGLELAAERLQQSMIMAWLRSREGMDRRSSPIDPESNLDRLLKRYRRGSQTIPFPDHLARAALVYAK